MLKKGNIVTKRCDSCGHHEVGLLDSDGVYRMLKPGMKVTLDIDTGDCKCFHIQGRNKEKLQLCGIGGEGVISGICPWTDEGARNSCKNYMEAD